MPASDPTSSVSILGDYNYQPDYVDPMGASVPSSGSQYDPLAVQKMKAEIEANKSVTRNRAGQPVTTPTFKDLYTPFTEGLAPMLAGAAKGTAASVPGLFGDIESLGRKGINYVSPDAVDQSSFLPTTEDYLNAMPHLFTGPAAHSEKVGEFGGSNIVGAAVDPFAAMKYAPAAGKLVGQGMMKTAEDMSSHFGLPSLQMSIMQGPKSRLWDSGAIRDAIEMESNGMHPKDIYASTGVFKGLDNRYRQEIADNDATIQPITNVMMNNPTKLGKILDHPELYKAYPEVRDLLVKFDSSLRPTDNGYYNFSQKTIGLNPSLIQEGPDKIKSTLLHEIQHHVQHKEGFELGGASSEFGSAQDMDDAFILEELMRKHSLSLDDAAIQLYNLQGKTVSPEAYELAAHGQASLVPFTHPRDRYTHIAGEMESRMVQNRRNLDKDLLRQFYPGEQKPRNLTTNAPEDMNFGLDRNPENSLFRAGIDSDGNAVWMNKVQKDLTLGRKPSAPPNINIPDRMSSIKEPGGNWDDTRLDMLLRQHLHQSIPTVLRTRTEPGKNWIDVANEVGFSPEQIDRTAKDFTLNNWIDKRLKSYIKNDLGTPKDPVRDLADQGITHMNDLGEGYERLHPSNQEVIYKMRERQGQQKEDYGKTNAGKDWENRSEYAVEPRSLREWAGDNPQRMHNNPGFQKALERDSEAKLNLFDSGAIRDLGFDHLTDELHAAMQSDTDLPQHLQLSTKDLERMTVPDAVRHVAKINKYRADLAEKATVKNLAEFRQNFPALKTYDNGMAWHELREPDVHDDQAKNIEILDKALKEEGELMGHCVGGYTNDVVDGNSRIFTLRDAKGKPHVTIETVPTTGLEESDLPFSDHHDVSQIKGRGNKEVVPKYHDYVLDFLNDVKPHVHLHSVDELRNVNAVDTSDIRNMAGGKEIDDNIRAAVPDLPRFISKDLFDQLVNQHYIKKPTQGYKRGGHIKSLEHDRMKFELMMRGKYGH